MWEAGGGNTGGPWFAQTTAHRLGEPRCISGVPDSETKVNR